jgi:hypothetical protein
MFLQYVGIYLQVHTALQPRRPTSTLLLFIIIAGHSGRAVRGLGLGRLIAGILGSNPAQGMNVCPRLSVLCCPV